MNPRDCTCEHVHASEPTCRSVEVSHGAVPESQRMFPAEAHEPLRLEMPPAQPPGRGMWR